MAELYSPDLIQEGQTEGLLLQPSLQTYSIGAASTDDIDIHRAERTYKTKHTWRARSTFSSIC